MTLEEEASSEVKRIVVDRIRCKHFTNALRSREIGKSTGIN
jgi:hypothetical protein